MTLVKVFNNALKEVASDSYELENVIATNNWSDQKKIIALRIIRQIREGYMLKPFQGNTEFLEFRPLTLDIEYETLKENDFMQVTDIFDINDYIKELLDDINKNSPNIKFSLGGYSPIETKITFYIKWEI